MTYRGIAAGTKRRPHCPASQQHSGPRKQTNIQESSFAMTLELIRRFQPLPPDLTVALNIGGGIYGRTGSTRQCTHISRGIQSHILSHGIIVWRNYICHQGVNFIGEWEETCSMEQPLASPLPGIEKGNGSGGMVARSVNLTTNHIYWGGKEPQAR